MPNALSLPLYAAGPLYYFLHRFFFACYTYTGYPLLLWAAGLLRRTRRATAATAGEAVNALPGQPFNGCTVIIPAFNEAAVLPAKIANTLQLSFYAPVQVIVVTDGSTDGSDALAAAANGITALHQPERKGKAAAINRAIPHARYQLLVLTDANTFLNPGALNQLAAQFTSAFTGAVCGEKRILGGPGRPNGETLYWQYEGVLKKLESRAGSVVGAAGELLAMRRSLFTPIPEQLILDDFWLSMQLVLRGYHLAYAPAAQATEAPAGTLREEFVRRTRIAAGVWQWVRDIFSWKAFLKKPFFAWQFFSHRICRWFITPVCLPLLLFSNLALYFTAGPHWLFGITLTVQLAAYTAALGGWLLAGGKRRLLPLYIPFYFVFIHTCMLAGYLQYLRGRHTVLWKKAER